MVETQGNIPVHVGVQELKFICFYTALPLYLQWSGGCPLSIQEVQMRDKQWVEMIPRIPDKDAISDKFLVNVGSKVAKKKFRPGQIDINHPISYEKYEVMLDYRETKNTDPTGSKGEVCEKEGQLSSNRAAAKAPLRNQVKCRDSSIYLTIRFKLNYLLV